MARPKKDIDQLRIHQTNIRLTKMEQEFAENQASLAGLSVANWIREAAFSKNALQVKVSPMHRAYYRQLVGVATNINQISRKINMSQYPKIYSELKSLKAILEEINKVFHE